MFYEQHACMQAWMGRHARVHTYIQHPKSVMRNQHRMQPLVLGHDIQHRCSISLEPNIAGRREKRRQEHAQSRYMWSFAFGM
jgi:hypothetical protein